MTFSIIGTGNIALFLGTRLLAAGHQCRGVFSRNIAAAQTLATELSASSSGNISEVKNGYADVCIIAVSDAAIGTVAAQLSFSDTILMHTAGAVEIDVLSASAADTALLWPVYSISRHSLPQHRDIPCAYEASSPRSLQYVQLIAAAVTDQLFEAKYEQRKWLHLSAVIGNNFVNHLMAICEQICNDNELPFSVLTPIIEQTFERLKHASPQTVQTGPAIRRDIATIQQQLSLLQEHPHWQQVYKAVTNSIEHL